MTEDATRPGRCLFCRMRTTWRAAGVPLCPICRDQLWDFVWASGIQALLVLLGWMGSTTFLAEETALFVALVVIKHRIHPPWETPTARGAP